MLQLWKLVLLCGLLTGTSASLLGNLDDDLSNAVNKLKPAVEKGLETIDDTLESVVQKLTADLRKLQESKAWHLAKQKLQEVKNLVNDALSKIISAKNETLGLNIINSRILKIKVELTPDAGGINIRVPVVADVTLALPVIGQVVNLKASLDLLTDVRVAANAQTGVPSVTIGKCSSDSDSISLTVLGGHNTLIGKAVNTVSSFLTKTVSRLVEKDVCPLIHTLLSTLDAHIVQDIIAGVGRGPEKQEAQHQIKLGECGKIERVLWASVSSLPSSLFESAEPAWENDLWLLAYSAQTPKRGEGFLEMVTPHEGGFREEEDTWRRPFYAGMFALDVLDRHGEIEGFPSVSQLSITQCHVSPAKGSLTIYKVCPTAERIQNQLTETRGIRVVLKLTLLTWDPHRYCLKMLKVSGLLLILDGLPALLSAQYLNN
ncbi:BPI fold-containing family A member 2 [Ursus americanus]|uniref:BPI fold-containing family A member 2 n=1 Tax=Ursus americanus TaxID=9643 RepID=UPI001E67C2CF|nr:BPI fold-containing family A member 2 [Ursus americanus]